MAKYIDAEPLINALRRLLDKGELIIGVGEVMYTIKDMPAVDVAPRWTPVTERLPAYGEDVLLSMNKDCSIGYLVPTYDERQYEWHHLGCFYDFNEVDAWMPLPSPFLGE